MNVVDIAVVVVLLASGVFALMRGFVYEVLAVAGWVAAALAAVWGLPLARPIVHRYIASQTLGDIAGGAVIFLVVLVAASMITHAIARQVQKSAIGSVDRSLGFAFGLVRGLVLASLCFMVAAKLLTPEPAILAGAKTRPLMAMGARAIQSLIPDQLATAEDKARDAADALDEAREAKDMYDRLQAPRPKSGDAPQNAKQMPAYDSHGLERLIETTK